MRVRQRRWFPDEPGLQLRAEGEKPVIAGYAAVFGSWTTLYKSRSYVVREVIRPGAFRRAIAEGQDVRALVDHDPSLILGRTRSGTLRLREDERGLHAEIDPPNTQVGRDAVEVIGRGDVNQMSFAFVPAEGGEVVTTRVEGGVEVSDIEIRDVDLFDVSVVTYPAYQDTEVALRSADVVRRLHRERLEKLQRQIDEAVRRSKRV